MLGFEVNASDVKVDPALSEEDRILVERVREARAAAKEAEAELSAASRAIVSKLRGEGLTVRDVAIVMGVSPQRVSALAS